MNKLYFSLGYWKWEQSSCWLCSSLLGELWIGYYSRGL